VVSLCLICAGVLPAAGGLEQNGWRPWSPREEIRPGFSLKADGGPDGAGGMLIALHSRGGELGGWRKTIPVKGGKWYRLTVYRKTTGVPVVRRNAGVELLFTDDAGHRVTDERTKLISEPFYLPDGETDARGWTRLSDTYRAPLAATHVMVTLYLRWARKGTAEYGGVSLEETEPPPPRIVRLAAVHYMPHDGKSPMDNCRQFAPLIAKAAAQHADLVVLGEAVTSVENGYNAVTAAEPVPGPSTRYFGALARKHNLYIVAGLSEREGHSIYNTAALLGPDGRMVGKYRKVCPARDECRRGVRPGTEYPVFQTRFGKLGIMICFDLFMPEVARNIANNGAEVIALPIWGGDPVDARAVAVDNQIYLVTSTYSMLKGWMRTGVWDPEGRLVVTTKKWGDVVVYEVDLNKRHIRPYNLGDFRGRIPRQRPLNPVER